MIVCCAAAMLLLADPTAQAVPVFRATTDLVSVTVSVSDKHGKPVPGLEKPDFVLMEEGKPREIELFARGSAPEGEANAEDLDIDLGMLFDTSESMVKHLRLSQESASRFLNAVPRARDLLTVFFDQDIRISRYDGEDQQGLFDRIASARSSGNTALYDAIAAYVARVGDTPGRKVMVLFTDGIDSISATSREEALNLIRSSRVTIYAIAFTGGLRGGEAFRALSFLEQAAAISGGQVFRPHQSRDLGPIYDRILAELGAQYVLGFTPAPARAGGPPFRKLKVALAKPGLAVRHRQGYAPPAASP